MLWSELPEQHWYNNSAVEDLLFGEIVPGSRFFSHIPAEKLDKRAFKCYIKLFDNIIIGILIRRSMVNLGGKIFFNSAEPRVFRGGTFDLFCIRAVVNAAL